MTQRPAHQIGERRFTVISAAMLAGGAAGRSRVLARLLPLNLHLVDLAGLTGGDASNALNLHLTKQGSEWRFLAALLVEEHHEATQEHALEVEAYLSSLTQGPAIEQRNILLGTLLVAMVSDQGGGSLLDNLRKQDPRRQ